jgi:transcriptional regulator with XRE-family HTH domain
VWNVVDTAGTPRTRALAAAMRRARSEAGIGVREVARRLDLSHTTVSQWETGKRVPNSEDVSAFLVAINVTGGSREGILELARNASDPNWLTAGASGVSQQLAGVIQCERTASEIIEWCPLLAPGLLQDGYYARAIMAGDDSLSRAEVETRVSLRLDRKAVLTEAREGLPPVEYTALVGESALLQQVGGAEVATAQCRRLLELGELPSVTLLVVPLGGGWHPGLVGPFALYNFSDSPSIVHLEHHRSGAFIYDEDDVRAYKIAAAAVRREALSIADSTTLIAEVIEKLERA